MSNLRTQHYFLSLLTIVCLFFIAPPSQAETINSRDIAIHGEIFFSPASGSFLEGSTFEVPVFINTKGNNINAIELHVRFDPSKLTIVNPSGGKSIIGLWVQPPSYDNTKGTVDIIGGIPNGLTTSSGLIVTMTFKAKATGQAVISIGDTSKVLLNDGLGLPFPYEANRATYSIVPRPPDGVTIYSETHPFQDRWYASTNPVFSWNQDPGVKGFSVIFDTKPNTIPPNTISHSDPTVSYEEVGDGLSYLHVKALKNGVWGSTSHYLIKIDTVPPAHFVPVVNYLTAVVVDRALVSFFTTDNLSGVEHYEVGVIDKAQAGTVSPAFFQTESPYQLPLDTIENARVIVRAFDNAGNIQDASIDVTIPFLPWKFVKDNMVIILALIIFIMLFLYIIHYRYGHHIYKYPKKTLVAIKKVRNGR